jgi:hypothetical protein
LHSAFNVAIPFLGGHPPKNGMVKVCNINSRYSRAFAQRAAARSFISRQLRRKAARSPLPDSLRNYQLSLDFDE